MFYCLLPNTDARIQIIQIKETVKETIFFFFFFVENSRSGTVAYYLTTIVVTRVEKRNPILTENKFDDLLYVIVSCSASRQKTKYRVV